MQKALAWADTPEGIGQLNVKFRCGEWRRELNNALAQTQAELVELHKAEDLHGVWCTDKRGRPPMQRAELETEVDALKLQCHRWLRELVAQENLWMEPGAAPSSTNNDQLCLVASRQHKAMQACRVHFAHLLNILGQKMNALAARYRKATQQ